MSNYFKGIYSTFITADVVVLVKILPESIKIDAMEALVLDFLKATLI
jgi:hypothetical protein